MNERIAPPPKDEKCWCCEGKGRAKRWFGTADYGGSMYAECRVCGGTGVIKGRVGGEEVSDLREDIRKAINRASREDLSDTPDFILAQYLMTCLSAFEVATSHRERWQGMGVGETWEESR